MFNPFKRLLHKNDDFEDLRSHVLSDRAEPIDSFDRPLASPPPTNRRYDDFTPKTADAFGLNQPMNQPPGPDPFMPPSPASEKAGLNYDILDRLNMIENQVAVIRSQTETINERLKNIDAKLSQRRY